MSLVKKLQEDPETGDLFISFTEDECFVFGIEAGDKFHIEESDDGAIILTKT